jgi:hypothetical protein
LHTCRQNSHPLHTAAAAKLPPPALILFSPAATKLPDLFWVSTYLFFHLPAFLNDHAGSKPSSTFAHLFRPEEIVAKHEDEFIRREWRAYLRQQTGGFVGHCIPNLFPNLHATSTAKTVFK